MKHVFQDPDLIELDRIWPLGQRLDVPERGTIIVAGAYEGRYLHYLSEMFPAASLHGYEPQGLAFDKADARLVGRYSVHLWHCGLATSSGEFTISNYCTDGASLLSTAGSQSLVKMVNAVEAFSAHPSIDLLLLNMEGYEWALIPYLLNEMMHHRIRTFAIQFHAQYVSHERAQRVVSYLSEYYDNTFNCPGWSYWRRK